MRRARPLGEIGIGAGACLLGLALGISGCDDGGGLGGGGPAAQFVGSWRYETATGALTCGIDVNDETPGGNKVFGTGVDATIVDLSPFVNDSAINCDFGFNVTGPDALALTDQTCAMTGGLDVVRFDETKDPPDFWRFSLLSAKTAEEEAQLTLTRTIPSDQIGVEPTIQDCILKMSASLRRVSKD